jgi:hypothetical protein
MTLSRPMALLVGALSAWPFVYFVGFMAMMATTFTSGGPFTDPTSFDVMMRVHLLTMVATMGLLVFYVTHVFRSQRLPQDQRVMWLLVLFMGNMLAFPIYWYLHVWRR